MVSSDDGAGVTVLAEIAGVGARAPLGLNALQVAMSYRARLFEPRGSTWVDRRGRRVGLCRVDALDDDLVGYQRMVALAAPALREAAASLPESSAPPLIVAVAEAGRADDDPRHERELLRELGRRAGLRIDDDGSALVRGGRVGGVVAVAHACELLRAGAPCVIVGGVDSYFHPEVIRSLDEAYRLHALGAEDGFVPGEGAAFLLLRQVGALAELPALATLRSAETADEHAALSEEPNLAAATTALLAAADGLAASWVLTDMNGERHRMREWEMVALRYELFDAHSDHLPEQLGDVGAATAAMAMVLASSQWQLGCAPADRALVLLSSEGAERGLLDLSRAELVQA
jgi:3-oxoacyl-[acyl-carrier-protein] synthase-1